MKAIVLAFTLKDQDEDLILKMVKLLGERLQINQNVICIHGFMPRKLLEAKHFHTAVIDAIEAVFPIRLNMHDGKNVLRIEMMEMASQLNATVCVIGEVKEGVAQEVELYRSKHLTVDIFDPKQLNKVDA